MSISRTLIVIAFDVDGTLATSNGPVTMKRVMNFS